MAQLPIRQIQILWGRSGGLCEFPDCRKDLTDEMLPRGEMAHIIARKGDGPRGNSNLNDQERNSHENLMLLCPDHHTLIDNDTVTWTIEKLQAIKQTHEDWIRSQRSKGTNWSSNLAQIDYLNVPRILVELASQGLLDTEVNDFYFRQLQSLRQLDGGMIYVLSKFKPFFQNWGPEALSLTNNKTISDENIGARIYFNTRFWTKNVPNPEKAEVKQFSLTGNLKRDPHIYCKVGQRKFYLFIDPRWITNSSAFVNFTSGNAIFAGIGILKRVEDSIAVATPLVIGLPNPGFGWNLW